MLNSSELDIAIGVVFVFLLLSVFATAINEVLLSLLNMRGRFLLEGVQILLGNISKGGTADKGLVSKIYNHGQVFGLFEGDFDPLKKGKLPSYIPARNFSIALLDSIGQQPFAQMPATAPNPPAALNAAVAPAAIAPAVMQVAESFKTAVDTLAIDIPKIGVPLKSMVAMAGTDATKLQKSVEDWFNSGMDRVSGRYKYFTQNCLFWVGLVIAIAMNASTIHIIRQLSNESALRQSLVAAATTYKLPASLTTGATNNQSTPTPAANPTAPPPQPACAPPKCAATKSTNKPQTTETNNPPAPIPPVKPPTPPPSPTGAPQASTDTKSTNTPTGAHASGKTAESLQEQIEETTKAYAKVESLGLPIGWPTGLKQPDGSDFPLCQRMENTLLWIYSNPSMIVGWLFTAFAISLGAPFWFDMLAKIMVVRSTFKPTEKSQTEGSKDKPST